MGLRDRVVSRDTTADRPSARRGVTPAQAWPDAVYPSLAAAAWVRGRPEARRRTPWGSLPESWPAGGPVGWAVVAAACVTCPVLAPKNGRSSAPPSRNRTNYPASGRAAADASFARRRR